MDKVFIKNIEFPTLVALTWQEQERGLMWKSWPPPVMCFPYKEAVVRKFWMKNTISPLDIVFCRENKIIAICQGTPLSTDQIGPEMPSDLVVELPAGTVSAHGIQVGDDVGLKLSLASIGRKIANFM